MDNNKITNTYNYCHGYWLTIYLFFNIIPNLTQIHLKNAFIFAFKFKIKINYSVR